ncbi:MAG: arylamine N-acetyltransferase [bacterium]|nr:arylamine N-acetyltransferase [bacterium]
MAELVHAHILRVPFENLSKLYYLKQKGLRQIPDVETFLGGIETSHFGGTCYANNYYFYRLLENLGFQVKLCGADMTVPDVHLVSIVTIAPKQYLIDTGYAAPFLSPLPRDLDTDHVISLGRERYVLKPRDERDYSCLQLFRDGKLTHGYTVKPAPRQIEEFEEIITDSYQKESTFMNSITVARFFSEGSLVVRNMTVIRSRGNEWSRRELNDREALVQFIFEQFGIPRRYTLEALKGLNMQGDAWS